MMKVEIKDKLIFIKPIKPSVYDGVAAGKLTLFACDFLSRHNITVTHENVTVASHRLFPNKFCLNGYPYYPNQELTRRELWHCKAEGKLIGSNRGTFCITPRGRKTTEEIMSLLNGFGSKQKISRCNPNRSKSNSILKEVETSPAFKKFREGKLEEITKGEICFILQGTLDSPPRVLMSNLKALDEIIETGNRLDMVGFSKYIQSVIG